MVPAERFRTTLREAGYKATPARLSVLDVMRVSREPLSPRGLIRRVGKRFDAATVYRTLKHLTAAGMVRPVDLRHNHAHYELADRDDHHHVTCMRCGRIEDMRGCEATHMYGTILRNSKQFAEIRQHSLEFYGVCTGCAKKSSLAKK